MREQNDFKAKQGFLEWCVVQKGIVSCKPDERDDTKTCTGMLKYVYKKRSMIKHQHCIAWTSTCNPMDTETVGMMHLVLTWQDCCQLKTNAEANWPAALHEHVNCSVLHTIPGCQVVQVPYEDTADKNQKRTPPNSLLSGSFDIPA